MTVSLFQGGKEYLMRAHFGLPSVEAEDKEGKPPISVKFEIPYFTTSGIQVTNHHISSVSIQSCPFNLEYCLKHLEIKQRIHPTCSQNRFWKIGAKYL